MDEKNPLANLVNFGLVLATAGWGVVAIRGHIESSRPSETEAAFRNDSEPQKVLSRLWQDPFESFELLTNEVKATEIPEQDYFLGNETNPVIRVQETNSGREDCAPGVHPFWDEIFMGRPTNINGTSLVLGVMLPGGPYREDKEVRKRLRYAVELALLTKNLGPEDGTHIFTNSISLDGTNSHIAFEWFSDDTNKDNHVCALWLNEDDFGSDCLRRLNFELRNSPSNASFYLIGPRASDALRDIARDTNITPVLAGLTTSSRFEILSPEATAGTRDVRDAIKRKFQKPIYHNWIAADEKLADLIADEIQDRFGGQMFLPKSNNVVAIITEQDTFYGRTIADALSNSLTHIPACGHGSNIWQFSYLRGLDGSKPPKEEIQDRPRETPATPEAALQTILEKQMQGERADGDSQLDYIVRLGAFLKDQDRHLQKDNRRIIAVGITGSDVYDKLILLQGLRSKLPEAVFFTTDLDASLFDKSELKYTRHLLVASGYPLDPEPTAESLRLEPQFPPFRDVYQAAVFRACQAAVYQRLKTMDPESSLTNLDADCTNLEGQLYEIGRNGPVPLNRPPPARLEEKLCRSFADRMNRNFWLAWLYHSLFYLLTLGVLSAVVFLAILVIRKLQYLRTFLRLAIRRILGGAATLLKKMDLWLRVVLMTAAFAFVEVAVVSLEHEHLLGIGFGAFFGFVIMLAWGWLYRGFRPRKSSRTSLGWIPFGTVGYAEEADRDGRILKFVLLIGAGVGCLFALFSYAANSISKISGEEPWNFGGGVSIWPCECLRLSAALAASVLLWHAYRTHRHHRRRLWCDYFGKDYDSPELQGNPMWKSLEARIKCKWDKFWQQGMRGRYRGLHNGVRPFFTKWWWTYVSHWKSRWEEAFPEPPLGSYRDRPAPPVGSFHPWRWWLPLVDDKAIDPQRPSIDAESLFKEYVRLGLLPARMVRLLVASVLYLLVAILAIWLLRGYGTPTLLLIRGRWSHEADKVLIWLAFLPSLFLLFYVLDTARHTARFLESLSHHRTRWPENLLYEKAANKGVQEQHLDGWLDVDFAAVHTEEVGKVMFAPFLIPLLLLLSRNSFFDNWTWPPGMTAVFGVNFLLAGISWALVRRAACTLRSAALSELKKHLEQIEASSQKTVVVPIPQDWDQFWKCGVRVVPAIDISTNQYVRRLKSLHKEMCAEKRGAYAEWFQDPTYFALFIPTGVTGILSVLAEFWLNR